MRRTPVLAAAIASLAGCAGGEQPGDEPAVDTPEPRVRVEIVEPTDGAVLAGPDVRVVLIASGIEIAPVTEGRPETAHHHLFLDRDLTAAGEIIPAADPRIVHLGGGQTEYTFEGVAPGPHRIIALLADLVHVPLDPPVADTVQFTVR